MRIIIAGGRDFNDYELLAKECNRIFINLAQEGCFPVSVNESRRFIEIVSGTANGADRLGERFAQDYELAVKRFPADWNALGKRAGYVRNSQMAEYAKEDNGVLIAFWNGISKGTRHMIDLAKKHGLKVFIVNY